MAKEPTRCESPACGCWTFRADGFCSDECARIVPMTAARGIGIVSPPPPVRVTRARRVRRSDGYIAGNGAWIATAEASYLELSRDLRDLDRKRDRARASAARSVAKVRTVTPATPRITAANLAPIGDSNH